MRDALLGFGGVALLYLPWVPTLLHQIQHTGAPWLNSPNFGAPVQISKGLLGGGTPTVALLLAGGSGLAVILQRRVDDKERTAVDRRAPRPAGHAGRGLARLAGLARLDHALPRRDPRTAAAGERGRAGARRASSGWSRS